MNATWPADVASRGAAPQLLRMPLGLKIVLTLAGTLGAALLLMVAVDGDGSGAAEPGVVHSDHAGRHAHQPPGYTSDVH